MIGTKVKIFCLAMFGFVSRISGQDSSPGSLVFSRHGNRAEIFIWTLQLEIGPGNRAIPRVNLAYVKRPSKTGNEIPKNGVSKLGKLKKQDTGQKVKKKKFKIKSLFRNFVQKLCALWLFTALPVNIHGFITDLSF